MNIGEALIDIEVISGLAQRIKVGIANHGRFDSRLTATDPVKDAEKIIQICKRLADTVSELAPEPQK